LGVGSAFGTPRAWCFRFGTSSVFELEPLDFP
jgi:hypothetical protein